MNKLKNKCIICSSTSLDTFLNQDSVPISINKLEKDIFGKLDIVSCRNCSHIFNVQFDKELVSKIYNNDNYSASLPVSPKMQKRFEYRAKHVIGNQNITNKVVLEVGTTNFAFSNILFNCGAKHIIAFEPSTVFTNTNEKITLIQDFITTDNIKKFAPNCNLVVMRHVLEHLDNPASTLLDFLQYTKKGTLLYIEVPNINNILKGSRFYDFFYEHVSYFSPELLYYFFEEIGHHVRKIEYLINGQHFGILIENTGSTDVKLPDFNALTFNHNALISNFVQEVKNFEAIFLDIIETNDNVAIYGAGGHAISVINKLNLNHLNIKCLFDLSPQKAGKSSPCGNVPIKIPSQNSLSDINTVIIIASLHQMEVFSFLVKDCNFKGNTYGTYPSIEKLQ